MIALQTLEEVARFSARYNLPDANTVEIESQGAIWYVVLLDVFTSKAEADAAADAWNASNQPESKPWVRPTGPLKQAAQRAGAADV